MESSKHDCTLSGTATSLKFFFSYNPFPSAKSFQFMNFSEAMFYENDIGFPYKHCYFMKCLPTRQNGVENRDRIITIRCCMDF